MVRTRVLVANTPRLVRDLVAGLVSEQQDLELVGEVNEERSLFAAVEAFAPDVVVVGLGESDRISPYCAALLAKRPHLKLLGVASGSDDSAYFWADVKVHSRRIENSERGLLEAIRSTRKESNRPSPAGSGKPS